jgi:hypothetical protein
LVGACANSHGQGMSQLQMSNQSPAKRHFGTVLMRLSPSSQSLPGRESEVPQTITPKSGSTMTARGAPAVAGAE